MIPEPDYSDEDTEPRRPSPPVQWNNKFKLPNHEDKKESRFDERGLILPKKLMNPCNESKEKKNIHREILFNKKVGIDVLNKKTELQKALEKHKEKAAQKEEKKEEPLTPLQKAIEERALRIEKTIKEEVKGDEENVTKTDFKKAKEIFNCKKP